MDEDERGIDELIQLAEEMSETLGLGPGMNAVRGTARCDGVALSVDLQGMLVGLELDNRALALGPERLAAEISRLTTEAGASALQEGMRVLKHGCGERLATTIGEYLGIDEQPAPAARPVQPAQPEPGRPVQRAADDEEEEFGGGIMVRG